MLQSLLIASTMLWRDVHIKDNPKLFEGTLTVTPVVCDSLYDSKETQMILLAVWKRFGAQLHEEKRLDLNASGLNFDPQFAPVLDPTFPSTSQLMLPDSQFASSSQYLYGDLLSALDDPYLPQPQLVQSTSQLRLDAHFPQTMGFPGLYPPLFNPSMSQQNMLDASHALIAVPPLVPTALDASHTLRKVPELPRSQKTLPRSKQPRPNTLKPSDAPKPDNLQKKSKTPVSTALPARDSTSRKPVPTNPSTPPKRVAKQTPSAKQPPPAKNPPSAKRPLPSPAVSEGPSTHPRKAPQPVFRGKKKQTADEAESSKVRSKLNVISKSSSQIYDRGDYQKQDVAPPPLKKRPADEAGPSSSAKPPPKVSSCPVALF